MGQEENSLDPDSHLTQLEREQVFVLGLEGLVCVCGAVWFISTVV